MAHKLRSRGVLCITNDVSEQEARQLAESGFVIRRVVSYDSLSDLIASEDTSDPDSSAGAFEDLQFALAESEERCRLLHDTMLQGVVYQDSEGRIVSMNPAAERILGETLAQIWAKTSVDRENVCVREDGTPFPGEEHPAMVALRTGETVRSVVMGVYNPREKQLRWIRISAVPIFASGDDKPCQVYTIFDDITEHKAAEGLLTRYQMLSESSWDIILFVGLDGRIIEANDAAVAAYGYSRDELLDLSVFDLRSEDSVGLTAEQMAAADEDGVLFETSHKRKNGELFPVEVRSHGATIGDQRMLMSVIRDITLRKKAERDALIARQEAERRAAEMESFISSMSDGVMLVASDGRIVLSNQAAIDTLRLDSETSLVHYARRHRICRLDGSRMPLKESAYFRALKGETVREDVYRMCESGFESKVITVSCSPVLSSDGRIIGATNVLRDTTDRHEFERQRLELFEREHHIADVLQKSIIPMDVAAEKAGYGFAARYRPALREAEIGGDFYDVFDLGENKIAVLIGDVAGKGLAATIRVAAARHSIRSYAYVDPRPASVLGLVNDLLCRDMGDESLLLTVFFAVLDTETDTMTYCSAGHEPPIVCRADKKCEETVVGGLPLGFFPNISFEDSSCILNPGDIVLMLTDGITEARTPDCVFFGEDGVRYYMDQHRQDSLEQIAVGLMDAATAHAGGQLQDDAALLLFSPKQGGYKTL